jgi:hypothetical protein
VCIGRHESLWRGRGRGPTSSKVMSIVWEICARGESRHNHARHSSRFMIGIVTDAQLNNSSL